MKKAKNPNIYRPNVAKIILIFLGLFLLVELLFVITFISSLDESFKWFTPILFIATCVFCCIAIKSTTYEITPSKLIHTKLGKVNEIYWHNIIYINEEFSEKHKMLLFYDNQGRENYLMFDKDGKIYEAALEKSRQISAEELKRRFPNIKL